MAASALARALAFIFVMCQSYFHWPSDNGNISPSKTYLTEKHHLAGLILARGGSKGIPKKNMAILHGQPLIFWALTAMKNSEVFTTIWVSTDDSSTSEWVAKQFPEVQVHHRSIYTATDDATSLIAVQEFLSFHPEVDAVGLVQATSPFVQSTYLRQAFKLLSKCDSVFSAYRSKKLRWTTVDDHHKETTLPLNFDPMQRPRRQEWSGEMVENGMFYFTMRDVLVNDELFQGPRTAYVEVPEFHSLEIDTPRDLEWAGLIMKNEPNLQISDDNDITKINSFPQAKEKTKSSEKKEHIKPNSEL